METPWLETENLSTEIYNLHPEDCMTHLFSRRPGFTAGESPRKLGQRWTSLNRKPFQPAMLLLNLHFSKAVLVLVWYRRTIPWELWDKRVSMCPVCQRLAHRPASLDQEQSSGTINKGTGEYPACLFFHPCTAVVRQPGQSTPPVPAEQIVITKAAPKEAHFNVQ